MSNADFSARSHEIFFVFIYICISSESGNEEDKNEEDSEKKTEEKTKDKDYKGEEKE